MAKISLPIGMPDKGIDPNVLYFPEIDMPKKARHVKCTCGGVVGDYRRNNIFTCDKCDKEYILADLDYDVVQINPKTGWGFPMKYVVE